MITEVKGHEVDSIKLSLDSFEPIEFPGLNTPVKKLINFSIETNSKKKLQELEGQYFIVDLTSFSYFHFIHSQIGQFELLKSEFPGLKMLMMIESQHILDSLMLEHAGVINDVKSVYGIKDIVLYSNTNISIEEVYFYSPRSKIIEMVDESFYVGEVASESDPDFYPYSIKLAELVNKKFSQYMSKTKKQRTYMLDIGKVFNQDRIALWATQKKYNVFNPVGATLFNQILTASSSSAILSIHGGNLTNIMFCNPGTHVIALDPYPNYLWFYRNIADALGLKMTVIDTIIPGQANTERLFGDK